LLTDLDTKVLEPGSEGFVEQLEHIMKQDSTPVVKRSDREWLIAQERPDYEKLRKRFDLARYDTLEDRREKMERRIKPRDITWDNEDTKYMDMMRDKFHEDTE
jgi:hypothetical protein